MRNKKEKELAVKVLRDFFTAYKECQNIRETVESRVNMALIKGLLISIANNNGIDLELDNEEEKK